MALRQSETGQKSPKMAAAGVSILRGRYTSGTSGSGLASVQGQTKAGTGRDRLGRNLATIDAQTSLPFEFGTVIAPWREAEAAGLRKPGRQNVRHHGRTAEMRTKALGESTAVCKTALRVGLKTV